MKAEMKSKMIMRTRSKRGRETSKCDTIKKTGIGLLMFGRMMKVKRDGRRRTNSNKAAEMRNMVVVNKSNREMRMK